MKRKRFCFWYTYTIFIFSQFFLCYHVSTDLQRFFSSIYKKLQFLHHNSSRFLLNSCNYCSCFLSFRFYFLSCGREAGAGEGEGAEWKVEWQITAFNSFCSSLFLSWRSCGVSFASLRFFLQSQIKNLTALFTSLLQVRPRSSSSGHFSPS